MGAWTLVAAAYFLCQETSGYATLSPRTAFGTRRVGPADIPKIWKRSHHLPSTSLYSSASPEELSCEVLVLGSGPAARSVASLLHSKSNGELSVLLSSSTLNKEFIPNYGAWEEEWDALTEIYTAANIPGLKECVDTTWGLTDCYFGGSFDIPTETRFRVDRAYHRIDRFGLKKFLTNGYRTLEANHYSEAIGPNLYSPPGSCVHDENGSTIRLMNKKTGLEYVVAAKLIVDCTGHETKLVQRERHVPPREPGFQIAYGASVEIEEDDASSDAFGPYDKKAMTLFDYRTDHFDDPEEEKSAIAAPTFMYAMPLGGNKVFFEETSLVARPAISFQVCKDRCFTRLKHLGIRVKSIEEEEFCYIPMGGDLPVKGQRIVGFGGASVMVHPSTGYHLCRAMMGANDLADVIQREFQDQNGAFNPDKAAARAYHSIWSPSNIRQRNFAVFGGEFLMKSSVEGLRGFFDGFFRLPEEMWAGFLAGWPGLPNNDQHETWYARLKFGLLFVSKLPPQVALDMFLSIISYSIKDGLSLPQSVTPFFGEPDSYDWEVRGVAGTRGDVAAKKEGMRMMSQSEVAQDIPMEFTEMATPAVSGGEVDVALQEVVTADSSSTP